MMIILWLRKIFTPLALCSVLILTASCDENNNVFNDGGGDDDMLVGSPAPAEPTLDFTGVGIDYDPEARCSDNNWSTDTPAACNPQLSFSCSGNMSLSTCPTVCQDCYDGDMDTIKNTLGVDTITIYQPNYYILTAAEAQSIKVVLGLFNDSVASLASRQCSNNESMPCAADSDCGMGNTCEDKPGTCSNNMATTCAQDSDCGTGNTCVGSCTYGGFPALCGTGHANSILNGACGTTTPWAASTFCEGSTNTYITPNEDFISGGTVIGIQVGNEVLSSADPALTKDEVVRAAKVMSNAISAEELPGIPMIVSLVAGNEASFCENGAPPPGVDYIAAHPYCNFVASVPPSWPFESGMTDQMAADMCWSQVLDIFQTVSQADCGTNTTYIGETGYNTGCPMSDGESTHLTVAPLFIADAVDWTCMQSLGTFLFAFADACPMGGCKAGCSSSGTVAGNGYFGLYYTENYDTNGTLMPKYSPLPDLTCDSPGL